MVLSLREAQGGSTLQLILGTDKRNPLVSIYQAEERAMLHVYYGLELMEVVPDQREHFHYKLLVARLYNAGVKARTLQEVFEVDRKTMKRWGEALQEGDAEKLLAVLAGRSGGKKITPLIESFVRTRFESLYRENPRSYSTAMRREIEEVFQVRLSGEALRPLFGQLRREWSSLGPEAAADGGSPNRESACAEGEGASEDSSPASNTSASPQPEDENPTPAPAEPVPTDRKQSPVFYRVPEGSAQFCHHAGVLLFSQALQSLREVFPAQTASSLQQWLAAVLLGAVNIEQSKFLDIDDLELLLGSVLRQPHQQRLRLSELGNAGTAQELLALNARQCEAAQATDFYYDPHTKHYTGQANILKGWCGNRGLADKALHTDFLHAAEGTPLYMEWTDNYNTLRERFLPVLARFREVAGIAEEAVTTITIDRGINSMEVFKQVIDSNHLHIITWETGYTPAPWPTEIPVKTIKLERSRNRANDVQSYHFEYIERPWKRNASMRQILVRATNPSGRTIEVSILTDDPARPAHEAIYAIFWRWLQENDFKYLDKHFGINEITSYATDAYKNLADAMEDKDMKNGQYQALEKERAGLKRELGRLLVAQREYRARQHRKKPRGQSRAAVHKTEIKRQERIVEIDKRLKEIDTELKDTEKEVSRLETLIEQNKRRLNTANKSVMDAIKVLGRNAFYRALLPFKHAYDNYRDDHDFFRRLTRSHGILIRRSDHLEVRLISTVNFAPKIRRIIEHLLCEINSVGLELPDGSGLKLRFYLGSKAGIQLAPDHHQKPEI